MSQRIAFVQDFGLGEPGGGARILRSLLKDADFSWRSFCTQSSEPREIGKNEVWIPLRKVSRLDSTRFHFLPELFDERYFKKLQVNLSAQLDTYVPTAVHTVVHSRTSWRIAVEYCLRNNLPLILTVHDDLKCSVSRADYRRLETLFKTAWVTARSVMVISPELGAALCSRFGMRDFHIVTDGLSSIATEARKSCFSDNKAHVYFCGVLHRSYIPNFISLLKAISSTVDGPRFTVRIRGGTFYRELKPFAKLLEFLPFSKDFETDFQTADLLYLPLPFDEQYRNFAQYSLSTKAISYLGSGVPILYHGPQGSALQNLLAANECSMIVSDLEVRSIRTVLDRCIRSDLSDMVHRALKLARDQFTIAKQQKSFENAITRGLYDFE
jgi:hypothetical protein